MTHQEANEAVKRFWGSTASANFAPNREAAPGKPYSVSICTYSVMGVAIPWEIGSGNSWEEAIDSTKEKYFSQNLDFGPNKTTWKQNEFSPPLEAENPVIRRYMKLERLDDLLRNKQLWFSRGDKLGDTFEGSFPKLDETLRLIEYQRQLTQISGVLGKDPTFEKYLLKSAENNEVNRKCFFANCWSINEYESSLMWGHYLKHGTGVCIVSKYENIINSFNDIFERPIVIGRVDYRDFESENIIRDSSYRVFFTKKTEFTDEKELRTLLWLPEYDSKFKQRENPVEGFGVHVDTKKLIQKIVVSPNCPQNFFEEVKSVTKRYGFDDPIQSSLSEKPFF